MKPHQNFRLNFWALIVEKNSDVELLQKRLSLENRGLLYNEKMLALEPEERQG